MPDDRRVVLHVGAHKTGTTVVQQFLAGHPATLRRRHIDYVARTALAPAIGWGDLLEKHPERFAALLADFDGGRRARTLLVSYENICGHPFHHGKPGLYPRAAGPIRALRTLLSAHRTTVVLSVRPQHELIESWYLQTVNFGSRTPFAEWLNGIDLDTLSWSPLVATLQDEFGADAVRIVDFHRIRAGAPAYVQHLLAQADLEVPVDHRWTRPMNASLSARGLELALRGNAVLDGRAEKDKLRGFLQRRFSNAGGAPRPVLLGDDVRRSMRARYADEYAALVAGDS